MTKQAKTVSEIIKRSRLRKNWTQKKLAEEVETSVIYISKLEQSIHLPGDELVLKLAEKLDLDKRDFIWRVYRERTSPDIRNYLPELNEPYLANISDDAKEFIECYEELDTDGQQKFKEIVLLMADYLNRSRKV